MDNVIFSSITKKFVMALAGLLLILFLPVHLIINFMLLKSDPEPFNRAAHFMATFPIVKIVEILLIAALLMLISCIFPALQKRRKIITGVENI